MKEVTEDDTSGVVNGPVHQTGRGPLGLVSSVD